VSFFEVDLHTDINSGVAQLVCMSVFRTCRMRYRSIRLIADSGPVQIPANLSLVGHLPVHIFRPWDRNHNSTGKHDFYKKTDRYLYPLTFRREIVKMRSHGMIQRGSSRPHIWSSKVCHVD